MDGRTDDHICASTEEAWLLMSQLSLFGLNIEPRWSNHRFIITSLTTVSILLRFSLWKVTEVLYSIQHRNHQENKKGVCNRSGETCIIAATWSIAYVKCISHLGSTVFVYRYEYLYYQTWELNIFSNSELLSTYYECLTKRLPNLGLHKIV